jgi:integrase
MPDWLQPLQPDGRPPTKEPPAGVVKDPTSFERAVERFAEQYVSRKTGRPFSPTSKRNVRDNLLGGPLTAYRDSHAIALVDDWSGDTAAEYLRWLQEDLRRNSATIKKVRGQLRSFGAFCEAEFHNKHAADGALASLRVSPVTDFDRRKDPPLTHGEADRLIKEAPTPRDRLAVAILLYTGVRPSELLALDESHVRLDRTPPVLEIRGTIHDPTATKSEAGFRDVPLTIGQTLLPRLLRAHLADPHRPPTAARLFISHRSGRGGGYEPLTINGLKAMLATLGETTGIKCNAYRFRHTFCTWCADAGMHMLHLQQLLGHASADMVAYYYRGKTSQAVLEAAARVRF